jgi:large subunit ribosomal protein L25
MKIDQLNAELRAGGGSAASRRLRGSGKVPGVLYGHKEEVLSLAVDAEALGQLLETGHHVVTLNIGEQEQRALLKEVQYDTWGREILHVDFSRVALDERVTVEVPVIAHGTPKAILSGAVLEQPLRSVSLECQADEIPDDIRVEVSAMELDNKIQVRDLPLPAGAVVKNEPDAIVFVVKAARVEEVVAEAAPAAAAEPELIGRAAKEEAEEGEPEGKS